MKAIETVKLGKLYENGVLALQDLNLSVDEGEIFGFLGPNGSGKSTTVRLLNGTLTPTAGSALLAGMKPSHDETKKFIATMNESAQMYESLTAEENLLFFARMYDLSEHEAARRIDELLQIVNLSEKRNLKLGSFSTGMRKRMHLARVLLNRPKILFLDEPTSGLDPESSRQVTDLIRNLAREEGSTVFLCTHNLPLAEGICDSFGFIHNGKLVRKGSKSELMSAAGSTDMLLIRTTAEDYRYPLQSDSEINSHIQKLIDGGHRILEVIKEQPGIEEIYFNLIKEDSNEVA